LVTRGCRNPDISDQPSKKFGWAGKSEGRRNLLLGTGVVWVNHRNKTNTPNYRKDRLLHNEIACISLKECSGCSARSDLYFYDAMMKSEICQGIFSYYFQLYINWSAYYRIKCGEY